MVNFHLTLKCTIANDYQKLGVFKHESSSYFASGWNNVFDIIGMQFFGRSDNVLSGNFPTSFDKRTNHHIFFTHSSAWSICAWFLAGKKSRRACFSSVFSCLSRKYRIVFVSCAFWFPSRSKRILVCCVCSFCSFVSLYSFLSFSAFGAEKTID